MHFQVFIYPQGIEGRGIEAGKKHIDYDQQIDLALFHLIREVFVVVLEAFVGSIKIGLEFLIVVINGHS